MMKTKLKTMIGVLRPNTGKGNCVQPKFTLGKMLSFLFVFISFGTGNLHAVVYDFEQWQQYAGATLVVGADYTAIDQGKVITSITSTNDGTLDLLTYGNPRISFNPTYSTEHGSWGWTNRPDKQGYGLRSYNAESYETIFGVCTLWNGDRVKITYSGGGSLHFKDNDVAKVDGTFVTANQVLESGTEFTMTSSRGDILLKSDNNNLVIRKIEVIPQSGSPAISFTEFTSAVNRVDMKVGDERMAYVNVTPSTSTPVFTSSDNTVATVNHYGYVQAVGSGTAIITAALTVGTLAPVYAYYYVSVTTSTTSVYTFDFTGCGTNSYVLQTTNEPTIKRINFLNHRDDYGDKVFETSQDGLTFPLDFFALNLDSKTSGSDVFTSGVFLQDGGIDFKEDCTFYITGLHNGDKVRINYYTYTEDRVSPNSAKTKDVTSTQSTANHFTKTVTLTEDGNLDIGISNPVLISSIEIEHEWAAASFSWSDASLSHKFDTSGEGKVLRYDLSTLNFQEPTAVVVPSTATYTIESSNHDVALMNPNTFGDILFVNTGTVDITGTLQTGSTPYPSDTYTVEVWANNANYTESGNTCTMSEIGMLNADRKTVTAISGILLEFGNPNDATLIVEDPSGVTNKKVAYTINKENGWRDKYPYDDSQAPTRGTFYKFTALTNGKLTFKGTKVLGTNDVVFVKVNNLSSPLYTSNVSTPSEITSTEITLTAGESYYLYGKTGETWEVFLLSEFTYVSDFQLVDANNNEVFYGATSVGATSATDVATIIGTTTPQASVVGYSGNIISASVDISDSKLQVSSIEGTGGAIRIMVTDGVESVNKRYFTLTVPYGAHTWDFRPETNNRLTKQGIVTYLKNNTNNDNSSLALSGLTRTYKVGSKNSQGQWISLVDPIIAVNGRVKGDNGFYFNETSGLIFETRSSGLGVKETACSYWTVTDDGETFYYSSLEDIPESMQTSAVNQSASVNGKKYDFDNEAQYRLTYKVTTEADYLMMRGESTIIFPGVHAGQYIKIYTYRHDTNDGETYKLKNLSDLDNNPYNQNHTITYHGILSGDGTSANAIRNCYGAATFKVTATPGTDISSMPAITLSDDGWAKVYKIEVCEDYSTHMKMSLNRGPYPEFIDVVPDCEYASIVVKDKNPVTQQYSGVCTQILVQNAGTCEFDVSVVDGTVNYTSAVTVDRTYNLLNVTYNGGRGVLKITQSEKSGEEPNRYTIDKKDFYIAVNELHSKFYPYTWDFTNYNMFQGSSSTTSNLTTPTGASYDGYGKWTKTSGTYGVNFKKDVALEDVTTPKVIFAHGSELCAGATPISETAGLGVSGAYTTTSIERSTGGVTYNYSYKMYSNTDGSIAINGNTLSGAGEITIPNVGDGMYIFVKANNEPSVTGASAAEDPFSTKDDVYLYQNTSGSTQDVVLSFASSTNVDIVAVTDIVKRLDKFGYATESRDRAIDHTYAGKLTSNDVDAYIITTSDDYGTTYEYKGYPMVKKTHVASDIVPPNTGIVLCKEGHNGSPFTSPLFVPAVNKVPANNEASGEFWMSNWMIPNVKNKLHESEVTSRNEATSEEPSINTLPYYDNGVISTPAWIMNASSSTIFGSIHSDPVRYVDLAGYKELHIYQSAGDPVRCFFVDKNRVSGSDYAVITLSSAPVHYVNSGEYYSLDLNSIYETYGQVKLIGIKASAHNTEAIVSDVKAIPYANPDATPCTKFVMTTSYYTYSEISNSFSEEKTATVESFYRVILDKNGATAAENNTLGANKALLLIPSNKLPVALWNKTSGSGSGARKGVIYIDLDEFEEQEATSVDNEAIIDHSIGNDVYYSISGTCISGKPTKKGFYIHNGKKVSVK